MPIPTTVTYSTLAEFQQFTRVPSQTSIVTGNWTPAALHAEFLIDEYVGYVVPYDEDQERKFPTYDKNGDSSIPTNVKKAHIELTSWLLLNGTPTADAMGAKDKLSESWSGSGYAYSRGGNKDADTQKMGLPPLVMRLLSEWNPKFGRLTI